jgi:hypothetical protein
MLASLVPASGMRGIAPLGQPSSRLVCEATMNATGIIILAQNVMVATVVTIVGGCTIGAGLGGLYRLLAG